MIRTLATIFATTTCLVAFAPPAVAQSRNFNIPAGSLRAALDMFARQSGRQVIYRGDEVRSANSPGVRGSQAAEDALDAILAGTGFAAQRSASGAFAVVKSGNAPAADDDTPPTEAGPAEIIVTGIRRSLQESIKAKRSADSIVDVVTAQDIGKLPDQNVAESMSRITGVQITRSEGEGNNFTVRGISQNRLLINGRSFLGPDTGGGASLESLSPQVISSIVVAKSPTADMIEGALGATVNLKTKRPLDFKDLVVSGTAQGAYTDQANHVGYRASVLISKNFNDKFGVLATIAYTDLETRGYGFDTGGWTRTNNIDGNGDGVNDPGLVRPNRLMETVETRQRRVLTFNGSMQFKPTDKWEIVLDGIHTRLNEDRTPIGLQILLNDQASGAVADGMGTVVSGTIKNVTPRPLVYNAPTRLNSTNIGLSTSYHGDRVEVFAGASYSKANSSPSAGSSLTYVVVPRAGNTVNATYDFTTRNPLPNLALNSNFNLLDPAQYRLASIFDGAILSNNKGYDGRVDFKIHTDLGLLKSIETGARFEHIGYYSQSPQNIPSAASLLAIGDKNGDGILTVDELPGLRYSSNLVDYYSGAGGSFPNQILGGSVDPSVVRNAFHLPVPSADAIPLGHVSIKDVKQDTLAFYIKGNVATAIGGMPLTGNVGVRYVSQQRLSSGYLSDTQPTASKSTFDFWLPSANLALAINPSLTFRASAAKVVAPPALNDVAVSFVPLLVSRTGSRGNPHLRPYQATQYDATLEWYFAPSSALTGAVFYKNVDSFTINLTQPEYIPGVSTSPSDLFQITQPVNGRSGTIKGFELSYQQAFRFLPGLLKNLGFQANYTFVDSQTPLIDEATQRRLPLPGLSKHSYNLIGYYEDDLFMLRVAYIYRNSYLGSQGSAAAGGSVYVAGRGQLDLSSQLKLTKNVRLTLEAVNLTKEIQLQYLEERNRLLNSFREDRRIFFGVSATF
ncbi:MAG TPA: TonB-dependent receptor [Sphingomonas sp.]